MRERTQAEIEAVLTAYHGADGWDEHDRADMSYALAAADEVAPPDARIEALEAVLRDARDRIPDWSTGSNAELLGRIKVILADAVSPPIPVVQREQPIQDNEIVRELKQLHLSLMSSEDARYRGDAFARAAICIEALEAAGKGLAEALSRLDAGNQLIGESWATPDVRSALAAWRAAEKGGG